LLVTGPIPFLGDVDAVVCDLDGVVYRGDRPVEGSPEAIRTLREAGIAVLFCSNNARPTLDEYVAKLAAMGVPCSDGELVTSPVVAAEVIGRDHPGARVFAVGAAGLREALTQRDLELVAEAEADVVVVGIDPDFDYEVMSRSSSAVRAGATFYATNDDATFPAEEGLRPGAGAIVASIEVASGVAPIVLGKPHRPMMEAVLRRLPDGARVAMVGDRPETDLDGARAMGWETVLVLSGVTSREKADELRPAPDLVIERLSSLVEGSQ
jgi:4-nitrophenyl phosphatase